MEKPKPRSAHALYNQASSVLTSNISQVSTVHTSYTKHPQIYARYHFPRGLGAPAIYIPAQLIYSTSKAASTTAGLTKRPTSPDDTLHTIGCAFRTHLLFWSGPVTQAHATTPESGEDSAAVRTACEPNSTAFDVTSWWKFVLGARQYPESSRGCVWKVSRGSTWYISTFNTYSVQASFCSIFTSILSLHTQSLSP
jgi:hypothetical protein